MYEPLNLTEKQEALLFWIADHRPARSRTNKCVAAELMALGLIDTDEHGHLRPTAKGTAIVVGLFSVEC